MPARQQGQRVGECDVDRGQQVDPDIERQAGDLGAEMCLARLLRRPGIRPIGKGALEEIQLLQQQPEAPFFWIGDQADASGRFAQRQETLLEQVWVEITLAHDPPERQADAVLAVAAEHLAHEFGERTLLSRLDDLQIECDLLERTLLLILLDQAGRRHGRFRAGEPREIDVERADADRVRLQRLALDHRLGEQRIIDRHREELG